MQKPLVSIIIPTYNSEKTLENCLKSIKRQTYKNIEVIIVDNFSNDKTYNISKKFKANFFRLHSERTKAKNFGASKSKGHYVCFIDSEMILTKKVIEECINAIETSNNVGGVVIPERTIGNTFWSKVRDFERSFYANTAIESARFFKTKLFKKVGGFDEDIVLYEEATLPQKIKRVGYITTARIRSPILNSEYDFSLIKWLKKKFYYGKSALKYKKNYREQANKQMSLVYRSGLFFKNKRFYSKPLLALGVVILKLLEYFSVGLGFLVSKVRK